MTKVCPFCKMDVPTGATVCGHCRNGIGTFNLVGRAVFVLTLMYVVYQIVHWWNAVPKK